MGFARVLLVCCVILMVVVIGAFYAVWPINDKETTIKHRVVTVAVTIASSIGILYMFIID